MNLGLICCICISILSSLHILPQPPQSLLRPLQNIILLADRKPQPIFRHPRILLRIKFRRRDRRKSQLHDQEPAEFEVTRSLRDMWWEVVICW